MHEVGNGPSDSSWPFSDDTQFFPSRLWRLATITKSSISKLTDLTWGRELRRSMDACLAFVLRTEISRSISSKALVRVLIRMRRCARMKSIVAVEGMSENEMDRSELSAGSPVRAVIGARLPRVLRTEWLRMLYSSGNVDGHSLSVSRNSESNARQAQRTSLQTTSTVPLD